MKFNTKILHGKAGRNTPDGGTLPGISQVSAFSYDSAEHLEKVFGNKAPGFAYTRIGNPTVAAFEQRINELEGGETPTHISPHIVSKSCSVSKLSVFAVFLHCRISVFIPFELSTIHDDSADGIAASVDVF